MRRHWKLVAPALACAAWPHLAWAQRAYPTDSLQLTRDQAVSLALAHNPQLRISEEQIRQARARVTENTAIPDPTLSADLSGQSGLTNTGSATGNDVGVGLTLPFPTRIRLRGISGNADVRSAEFSLVQLRQQMASQTVAAYDALLVAERHRADLIEARALADTFLQRSRVLYANGRIARLDEIKAQVDLGQADNDLIAAERDVANARATLNRQLGRMLGSPVEAADSLTVPPDLPALDTLVVIARQSRPEILGLQAQQRGAAATTSLMKQFWLPDVSLSATRSGGPGVTPTYSTGLGISVPLFFWNHTRGEVSEAVHHEAELRATAQDLEAQVDLDVRTAYTSALTALRQAVHLRDEVLPEAREAYRIASISYGLGGASALDVLDARRTMVQAETDFADALGAANDARADLERAVGVPLARLPAGSGR